MKLITTLAAAALSIGVISCSSETPVVLDYSDVFSSECDIIRDQFKQSQAMLRETGREMDRQSARDGYPTNYERDMLAQDKAMYRGMASANGCTLY